MLEGRHIEPVKNAYMAFWEKVTKLTGAQAKRFDRQKLKVTLDAKTKRIMVTTPMLEIHGASSRPNARSKHRYKIFLESQCTIEGVGNAKSPTFVLTRCTVRVLWIEDDVAADKTPKALRGLHFDYAEDDHHPVFHVQVDDHVLKPEGVDVEYNVDVKRHETPRIPTAPMDLCGTVYMILHDHFSSAVLQGWGEECLQAIESMPKLPCKPISDKVKERGRLDCAWWYPQHQHGYPGSGK